MVSNDFYCDFERQFRGSRDSAVAEIRINAVNLSSGFPDG